MYGHNYKWSLEKLRTVLNISSQGRLFNSDETHTNVFTKYNCYHPQDANYINASLIQNTILKRHGRDEIPIQHNWDVFELKEKFKLWENVLTTNVFVKIGSKGNLSVIVGYMIYCIETHTPFNFAYFMANRMAGLKSCDRLIPYARLLTRLFEVAKSKHPKPNQFQNCKSVDPIFSTFNMSNFNVAMKHGASSSQAHQMNPEEKIESKINSWFEDTTWSEAEREISPNMVLDKEEEEKLNFGERMAYKSYLSTKRQHRESRTKMDVLKNFMMRWARSMSCKDI
ncbi:hypothetical protein Tco_1384265 [Tanacetum coccineum]